MESVLQAFQNDLKNGMSISEGLSKYNLTFQYAVENIPKPRPKKEKKRRKYGARNPDLLYIQHTKGKYYLRKQVRGKIRMFGTYTSLQDAILMREYCMKHGWKQQRVDEYCKILGIERHKDHRSTVRYH